MFNDYKPTYSLLQDPWRSKNEAQDALAFAYQYGYPLYAYGRFTQGTPNAKANTFYHERVLSTANWTKVVRPNVDTLYSTVFIDLSSSDLSCVVPAFDDRYWLFSFYDVYGNNFANIGSLGGHKPGNYLLRMASENIGVQGGADGDGYKAYINFPTPYGTFIARQVVKNKAGDVEKIHMFQDATGLSSVPRTSGAVAPTFDLGLFREVARSAASEEEQVLRLTAALAPYNQPEVLQDRSWVAHMLEKAGIRNGNFVQPPDTSLTAARDTAKDSAIALRTTAGFVQDLGNRWKCSSALINGDFKSFYSARFFVAERGYLQLTSDQAIYPTFYSAPGVATLEIEPKQACLFTFSSKPKLQPTGFWSLTLYGEDHLLVSNQLDRYALGDRSNLRYSDGTLLREVNDGKFQILIQPSAPPAHWIDNWLPAPASGRFSLTLRLYAVTSEMADGSYEYPEVSITNAINE